MFQVREREARERRRLPDAPLRRSLVWFWPILAGLLASISVSSERATAGGFEGFTASALPPAVATSTPSPSDEDDPLVNATRLEGEPIHVDGRLDDTAWRKAEPTAGFRMHEPDRGKSPTEQTIFKVAYDDDALYFGVACLERDPKQIAAKLSRRDKFSDSDLVSIYLDPYFDRSTGYNFRVNPLGVQEDSYLLNNDGERDTDWDAVWEAETFRDDAGWYAEFRIPFSSVRFKRASDMTWGLQVYRYMHSRGEDTGWACWERDSPGFVSHWGRLAGLRGVSAPRQLELLPYVVERATDPPRSSEVDGFQNAGLDLKYGITSDLTLNATVQPDFGQVEADPAVLNLSPFETFFSEKRPFFIEGSGLFQMPEFSLFYSRRIGTGDENARIRYAGKLTGKLAGNTTLSVLSASTDVAGDGQAHNLFKAGKHAADYLVARLGREWSGGRHRIGFMQTAVQNSPSVRPRSVFGYRRTESAYSTGVDWESNFKGREWTLRSAFVGTIVDPLPEGNANAPDDRRYGTGGNVEFGNFAGQWRGAVYGRWEGAKLDPNDAGQLQAPDEVSSSLWLQRRLDNKGKDNARILTGNINFNLNGSWLYAARSGRDVSTGEQSWAYGRLHGAGPSTNVNGWMQWRGFQETYYGAQFNFWGSQRYETRGGPLISEPATYGFWCGGNTDSRKNLIGNCDLNVFADVADNISIDATTGASWTQSASLRHSLNVSFNHRVDDTQYLETVRVTPETGGLGIGGLSYVFGDITQHTISATLRSSVLFDRNQSFELYLEPFQSYGTYSRVRELEQADTYDLIPYRVGQVDPSDYDFAYGALNLNAVYRWEYRPGSTFFLVWSQNRGLASGSRYIDGRLERVDFDLARPFDSEPENTFLAKLTYWLPI